MAFWSVLFLVFAGTMVSASSAADLDWWKTANFYQIYPRSFKDSNNDGIGDLKGIIQKIDHFNDAGVNAVWLSPIFKSPQVDQGYDISDYRDIEPDYGTIEDVQKLIEEAHKRDVKVILDFVPNHSSDKHQWFLDSVKGVEKYKDYYLWADAKIDDEGNRQPPNNWVSNFRNSAWTWNDERKQYYYHNFMPAQPDLNYRNPDLVEDMKDVLRFWMDKGVDGFRVDAVPFLFENPDLLDEPMTNQTTDPNDYNYLEHIYTMDLPETLDMIYQWRKVVDDYTEEHGGDQRVMMTEAYTDQNTTMLYYGTADGSTLGAHFTFNFNLITQITVNSTAPEIVKAINSWLEAIPEIYVSNWVLGNHDQHRVASRFGQENADGFNMLKALLPGIAVTYNGEEIAMENGEVTFEQGQDPQATDPDTFDKVSRDFERTPFHWDDTVNAGFNEGHETWLPVSQKYKETNLKAQKEADVSHFKVYQQLSKMRNDAILIEGELRTIKALNDDVILLQRYYDGYSLVLVFNKAAEDVTVDLQTVVSEENKVVLTSVKSSKQDSKIDPKALPLAGHEAVIIGSLIEKH